MGESFRTSSTIEIVCGLLLLYGGPAAFLLSLSMSYWVSAAVAFFLWALIAEGLSK